jgi:hypothetical protein
MHSQHHDRHHHLRTAIGVGLAILLALMALLLALPSRTEAAPHPHHNRGLTIAATPDPITAGQGVLIYGQLKGPNNAGKRIWLFHRINPASRFTPVSVTRTNAGGFYEFVRADGVVNSNRNWFVLGPDNTHSHTLHEWVSANVTLSASAVSVTTDNDVMFSGTIFPAHPHQRVLLQQQNSTSGNGWQTIASGYTNGASAFSIAHRFRSAGSYTLRAFFPNDPRNIASQSDAINLTVQQQQNPSFTINGSAPTIVDGQTVSITGTLYAKGSTTTVQPGVPVTLYGRQGTGPFRALVSGTTDASGNYTFTQMPVHNSIYHVVTGSGKPVKTANLYVGVQDVVSATLNSSSTTVGGTVTIAGTVTPDHAGHVINLQEQNSAGQWVDVQSGLVNYLSLYQFAYTPGQTGTVNLRVQITGGPWNVGGVSPTQVLTVNGTAPVNSLPPAS